MLGNSKATVAATHKIIPQLGLFSCDVVHSLGTGSELARQGEGAAGAIFRVAFALQGVAGYCRECLLLTKEDVQPLLI